MPNDQQSGYAGGGSKPAPKPSTSHKPSTGHSGKLGENRMNRFVLKYGRDPDLTNSHDTALAWELPDVPVSAADMAKINRIEQSPSKAYPTPKGGSKAPAAHGGSGGGSGGDLMSLIHEAGFTGQAANTMYGIVLAESSGDAKALDDNPSTGDLSYGLAQINMIGSMGPSRLKQYGLSSNNDLYDPLTNLKVAYALSNGGRDFTPWTTYTSGAYRSRIGQTGAKVTNGGTVAAGSGPSGSGGITGDTKPTKLQYAAIEGGMGKLLSQVPELRQILNTAQAQGWGIDKFTNKVEDSHWFRTHSQTVRSVLEEQANDPATWARHLQNAENTATALAKQLGFHVDPATLKTIATNALLTGNDTNQDWLTGALGHHQDFSKVSSGSDLNGQMASNFQSLQQMSKAYGLTFSATTLSQYAEQIALGSNNLDHYQEQMKQMAAGKYPGLVSQLQAGQTVQQIADPYVQEYANLLELDPNTVDWSKTALIQQALQGQPTGQGSAKAATSLNVFEKQVRTDPRWQYTQNAKDSFSTALLKVGNDFGFGGAG